MKKFYMLVGFPGSGKSTIAAELEKHYSSMNIPTFVYSTDRYIETFASEVGKTYNEVFSDLIKEATKFMDDYLLHFLSTENNSVIIWDQTNLTKKSRASKLAKIPDDYEKEILLVWPYIGDIFKRNEERKKVGRAVPDNILSNMIKIFESPTNEEAPVRDVTKDV